VTLLCCERLDEVGYSAVVSKLVTVKLSEYVSTDIIFVYSVDMCLRVREMFILEKLTRMISTLVQCGGQTCVWLFLLACAVSADFCFLPSPLEYT